MMNNSTDSALIDLVDKELTEKIKDLPITLSVQNVADFLGVCLTTAYVIVGKPDFPKKRIEGVRRHVIPKAKFIAWYLSDESSKHKNQD